MTAEPLTTAAIRTARIRTRWTLITGQVLAGLGMGATLSAGALLVTRVSGTDALSGLAVTMWTVGAAAAAVPLAALAARRGRAPALSTGAFIAAVGGAVGLGGAVLNSFPILLLGFVLIGSGTAVNLQSRFAATDLSGAQHRGRDLAVVVWATTVGAVLGPNLIQPANNLGVAIGLPELAGPFLFTIVAQLLAGTVYLVGLRPDPLALAKRIVGAPAAAGEAPPPSADPRGVRAGMIAVALSHATMVSIMAMTPVHLVQHGASLAIVGLTISLHVLGMYGFSPVFGVLADRVGREFTIVVGQVLLLAALLTAGFGADSETAVTVGLVLLGLGWSGSTVAGSTLIAESADPLFRTRTQGRSDLLMSGVGALGGASAGLVLAMIGYSGLALVAISLVVVVLATMVWRVSTRGRSRVPVF